MEKSKVASRIYRNQLFNKGQGSDNIKIFINDLDYFEMPGLNVFVYQNTYLEDHHGGVEIIQQGALFR
ncbi:MAG TPA: hypothetical protein VII93_02820 [Anaerolineales bacterium]